MIDPHIIQNALEISLQTGGDFAQLYLQDTLTNTLHMIEDRLENAVTSREYGVGIQVLYGTSSAYATTSDTSEAGLAACARNAAAALANAKAGETVTLGASSNNNVRILPNGVSNRQKADQVRRAYAAAKGFSAEIRQVSVNYQDRDHKILIANSQGLFASDRQVRTRMGISAVAANHDENQTGFEGPGRLMGFEFFDHVDIEDTARQAANTAVTMLHAPRCPSCRMPVIIENGFGGVIFHEACGHLLEATSVAKGNSPFAGQVGQVIAARCVSAVDDGTIAGEWGSFAIDDEGTPAQRNILIENGVLRGYLVDRLNARRMGGDTGLTGSARRQNYRYTPTSRMSNTYICTGHDTFEEMLASMGEGLYARRMGGGSVNPVTGEFNFAVTEGYWVKNGRIDHPVRGASLIGKGPEILLGIDRVGDNLVFAEGMCGSASGSIPTNVGQPRIRVREMIIGGHYEGE